MARCHVRATLLAGLSGQVIIAFGLGALALLAVLAFAPTRASADSSGGQASAYNAYRRTTNTCTLWAPLFQNKADGWSSTLTVRNQSTGGATVVLKFRPFDIPAPIYRSVSVPASGTAQIVGSQLGLPDNFSGSLTASACPSEISGVVVHEKDGYDALASESVQTPASQLFIPGLANEARGMSSRVVIYNTDLDADAPVTVTYRLPDGPSFEQAVTIPKDAATSLDLSTAPKGFVGLQIESHLGNGLVAAVYYYGPNGNAAATNGVSTGAKKMYLPLLYRKTGPDGVFDSGVRVINLKEGRVLPRITFTDRDTGERIGPIQATTPLREGGVMDWLLPDVPGLVDGKVYSATVEVDNSEALAGMGFMLSARGIDSAYAAITDGDTNFSADVLYRRAQGLDSGIEVQNLTGSDGTVTVRFRNARGNSVATWSGTAPANNIVTIYLPQVNGLPDGFVGTADITSTVAAAVIVSNVRYAEDPRFVRAVPLDPAASLYPSGVAIDRQGNAYLAMALTGEIRRIAPGGAVSPLAVIGPPPPTGMLNGLAVDGQDNVYAVLASNDANHGVWRVTPSGEKSLFASLPTPGMPNGLVLDSSGNLYVSDSQRGQIFRVDTTGAVALWSADPLLQGSPTGGVTSFPVGARGIALDQGGGNLLVVVADAGRVVRIPITAEGGAGTATVFAQDAALRGADGITFDGAGQLYVAVNWGNRLVTVSPQGQVAVPAMDHPLRFPSSLAFGTGGNAGTLYITNSDLEIGSTLAFRISAPLPALLQFTPGPRPSAPPVPAGPSTE
jgi:sugar lactone lactonase YvrE